MRPRCRRRSTRRWGINTPSKTMEESVLSFLIVLAALAFLMIAAYRG
jgi:hypothetical protein